MLAVISYARPETMIDDFVEHAGSPSVTGIAASAANYQGFESFSSTTPHPWTSEPLSNILATDSETSRPIFELGRVQFEDDIPAPITAVVVCSDLLVLMFSNNTLFILELQKTSHILKVDLPKKPSDLTLNKLFLDPSGRHLLINFLQGETWYLYRSWKKPKPLKRFNSYKLIIDSVAWDRQTLMNSKASMSTGEFLLGTRSGAVFEACLDAGDDLFKSQERFLRQVFQIQEKHPIAGITFEYFPPSDARKCLILVATTVRIYQFVGLPDRRSGDGNETFTSVFANYRETMPRMLELPGQIGYSELRTWNPHPTLAESLPSSMCWLTTSGIYHGNLNFKSSSDDFIDSAELLPYPPTRKQDHSHEALPLGTADVPLSITLTQFHFVLLYKDRLITLGTLDQRLDYEELLPLKPGECVLGFAVDPTSGTYWVYTNLSLFELLVGNEDRDVWAAYLERGERDLALRYVKEPYQKNAVLSSQALAHFSAGHFIQAAQCYAQCSVSFEEVTLMFMDENAKDALRYYLNLRLDRTTKTDTIQRMMLATWLVEFYLGRYNGLEDSITAGSLSQNVDDLKTELIVLEEDFKHFLETYKSDLDAWTVYELIQNHGRDEIYLYFAAIVGHHDKVVEYWVLLEDWSKALIALNRQNDRELHYRYSSVLMKNSPKETIDSWLKIPSLDPLRLVPAILQNISAASPRCNSITEHAVRYLNHLIYEAGNTSPVIHNLLITLHIYSGPEGDTPLLQYLSHAPTNPLSSKPYFDLDYALRLCVQRGRMEPCVHIYSQMGLWEDCVNLALSKGDLELAKANASRPENDPTLRKKLWLKVAKFVVEEQNDIKTAMKILEITDALKIEDILPLFPDFVLIDDFKEEICSALESYSKHIENLRTEMNEATRNAEALKADISNLKTRLVTLDAAERCSYCSSSLLIRQFYVFPCQHAFHADCLISLVKEVQQSHVLRKIVALQAELLKTNSSIVQQRQLTSDIVNGETRSSPAQRNLLSANFVPNGRSVVTAAGHLGRGFLTAGDRIRDLIVPESLAVLVGGWSSGAQTGRMPLSRDEKLQEKIREELDSLLASSCPRCDSVAVSLDRGFVQKEEIDIGWEI